MLIGMLWGVDDPKTKLVDRVISAKAFYERKYGGVADYCLLSGREYASEDLVTVKQELTGMRFVLAGDILPRHLVIGKISDCKEKFDDENGIQE